MANFQIFGARIARSFLSEAAIKPLPGIAMLTGDPFGIRKLAALAESFRRAEALCEPMRRLIEQGEVLRRMVQVAPALASALKIPTFTAFKGFIR